MEEQRNGMSKSHDQAESESSSSSSSSRSHPCPICLSPTPQLQESYLDRCFRTSLPLSDLWFPFSIVDCEWVCLQSLNPTKKLRTLLKNSLPFNCLLHDSCNHGLAESLFESYSGDDWVVRVMFFRDRCYLRLMIFFFGDLLDDSVRFHGRLVVLFLLETFF